MNSSYQSAPGWAARHMLLASDVVSLSASFFLAWRLVPVLRPFLHAPPRPAEPFGAHVWLLAWIIPLWLVLGQRYGLYPRTPLAWGLFLLRAAKVQALGLGGLTVLLFALKLQTVSRLIVFGFAALYIPVAFVARATTAAVLEAHRSHIYNIPRILVVGTGARARGSSFAGRDALQGRITESWAASSRTRRGPRMIWRACRCWERRRFSSNTSLRMPSM